MPILKSFFGSSNTQVPAATPGEMSPRSRAPSVVARLMGLDMLPPEPIRLKKQPEEKVLQEKRVQDSNTLVDITASGKQLNRVTGRASRSSQKSKSFDGASGNTFSKPNHFEEKQQKAHGDLELRRVPQGAECVQSIQLHELNKELLAKHMQLLDELNEAKQLLRNDIMGPEKQRTSSRKLTSSSEFLDALELLQANRQFFEKYFQGSEEFPNTLKNDLLQRKQVKQVKEAKKIPYFLNGQSSPRPSRLPLVETSEAHGQIKNQTTGRRALKADMFQLPNANVPENRSGCAEHKRTNISLESHHGKNEVASSIVLLKPRRTYNESGQGDVLNSKSGVNSEKASQPEEKAPAKDPKEIAKMIAKKIKESIAKEVAKTFYSKVDTNVSPCSLNAVQRGSSGRSFELADLEETPSRKHLKGSSQPSSPCFSEPGVNSSIKKKSSERTSPGNLRSNAHEKQQPQKKTSQVESHSPRSRRLSKGTSESYRVESHSPRSKRLSKGNSESCSSLEEGSKLNCTKNVRVVQSHRNPGSENGRSDKKPEQAKANSPKYYRCRTGVNSPDSPRIPPKAAAPSDDSPRPSKPRSLPSEDSPKHWKTSGSSSLDGSPRVSSRLRNPTASNHGSHKATRITANGQRSMETISSDKGVSRNETGRKKTKERPSEVQPHFPYSKGNDQVAGKTSDNCRDSDPSDRATECSDDCLEGIELEQWQQIIPSQLVELKSSDGEVVVEQENSSDFDQNCFRTPNKNIKDSIERLLPESKPLDDGFVKVENLTPVSVLEPPFSVDEEDIKEVISENTGCKSHSIVLELQASELHDEPCSLVQSPPDCEELKQPPTVETANNGSSELQTCKFHGELATCSPVHESQPFEELQQQSLTLEGPPEVEKNGSLLDKHMLFSVQEIDCPIGREEDLMYLRNLVAASGLTEDGIVQADFSLDSSLFEKLEDHYSQQSGEELFNDPVKVQASAIIRWLIFDLANEVLSRQAWKPRARRSVQTGKQLVQELWASICDCFQLQESGHALQALVNAEIRRETEWFKDSQAEVAEVCQQIERAIFNELIEEAVLSEVPGTHGLTVAVSRDSIG